MFSRLSLRAVQDLRPCQTLVVRTSTTAAASERDLVNFPKFSQPEHPPKVRFGFIPDTWFTFFHSKTGVTGPYAFGIGFITFLYSKEIMVMEHDFFVGLSEALMVVVAAKKFGPNVAEYLDKMVDERDKELDDIRDNRLGTMDNIIAAEKGAQETAYSQATIYEAKKENVGLQLESAYRARLTQVHREVKRRLDYQLETNNVKTRLEQRHMVNWIVGNVRKAITPTQETAALKQCLVDLKAISVKA